MNRGNIGDQQTVKMAGDVAMSLYLVRDLAASQEVWVAHRKCFRLALFLSSTLHCWGRPNFVTAPHLLQEVPWCGWHGIWSSVTQLSPACSACCINKGGQGSLMIRELCPRAGQGRGRPLGLANSGSAPLHSCFVKNGSFSLASCPEVSLKGLCSSLAIVKLSTLTPRPPF